MDYAGAIAYLYDKLPMFSRVGPAAMKPGLTNTYKLCEALGNPQEKYATIHIAGTNGKGSVSHSLAAILQTAGHKTGLYTSPHLFDFRERIRVNGKVCTKDFIISFTERVRPLIESIQPSFFEITVAMAFEWFAQQGVEIAVIETGLGGRLDSTNVITPILSVITNIGFDHIAILGDTLPKIAYEKAGIIKNNVPIVIGEWLPETRPVFEEKATNENAPIYFSQELYQVTAHNLENDGLNISLYNQKLGVQESYLLDLMGDYQLKNVVTVLGAADKLFELGWGTTKKVIRDALHKVGYLTGLHGRWETIHHKPTVVIDVGHNEDGIKEIVNMLQHSTYQTLHLIMGFAKDKDLTKVLELLPKGAIYYFTQASLPRALPVKDLAHAANIHGIEGGVYQNVNLAIEIALKNADKDDLILVFGSFFIIGELDMAKEKWGIA